MVFLAIVQLVKSLAASVCSLTQEVTGSTPGADGLTQATILPRSGEMNSNYSKQRVTAGKGCGKVAELRIVSKTAYERYKSTYIIFLYFL